MRINAADTNLSSNTANSSANQAQQKITNLFMPGNYQDSYSFSSLAGKLRVQGNPVTAESVTKPGDDKTLRMMEEQMSVVGRILVQQKKLAEMAKDETLSDLDRMDLQIEMSELQRKLTAETRRLSMQLAGMSPSEIYNGLSFFLSPYDAQGEPGKLEKARERIVNGEEWDLSEVLMMDVGPAIMRGKDEEDTMMMRFVEDIGGKLVAVKDDSLPTVSDYLEMLNIINIMDVESAAKGEERIDKQIQNLAEMKEALVRFREEYGGNPKTSQNSAPSTPEVIGTIELEEERKAAETKPEQERKTVETELGTWVYETDSSGNTVLSDPRLQNPSSPLGQLFARLESLFKDKIEKSLGMRNPFDSEMLIKLFPRSIMTREV